MGRQQHSKDRMFITASEWASEYGGHKKKRDAKYEGALPFDCCALTLRPYETPMCTKDGVIFDMLAIVPFVKEHRRSPVTGVKCSTKDLIRLKMAKNAEGKWHCPVTCKVFNDFSKVTAIATTGNVYSTEAVHELCIKTKDHKDLLESTPFSPKTDALALHDPEDPELCARRDLANFVHLREEREQHAADQATKSQRDNIRTADSVDTVLAAARANVKKADEAREAKRLAGALEGGAEHANKGLTEAYLRVRSLGATTHEVLKGSLLTSAATSSSFTSTVVDLSTSARLRPADDGELKAARWKVLRGLGKKGYVQLQTTHGNLNVEVHCDMTPRAAENFLTHCANKYYDGLAFHRIVPDFIAQGGDPRGDGTGGESIWADPEFDDEFDSRLTHDAFGVLAYANSGRDKNKAQFYLTLGACKHLDNKHTIFGKVVGGADTLRHIGAVAVDANDDHRPREPVKILATSVFVNPVLDADARFEAEVREAIARRDAPNPKSGAPAPKLQPDERALLKQAPHGTKTVGKYLPKRAPPPPALLAAPDADVVQDQASSKKRKAPAPAAFSFSSW